MKQLVLVAVLSALASSALTLLGASLAAPERAPSPSPASAPIQPGLEEIARELAALRRDLAAARGSAEAAPAAIASPGAAAGVSGPIGIPPAASAGPAAPIASSDRGKRIEDALDREAGSERHGGASADTWTRWMLRSEREVVDWFGVPDRLGVAESGVETWQYDIPESARVEGNWTFIRFDIHAGRVVSVR